MNRNTSFLRKFILPLLLSLLAFSFSSKANPNDELIQAVKAQQWHLAKQILEIHPDLYHDQILLFAAQKRGWNLVEFVLDRYPNANFNWRPTAWYPTALWFVAALGDINLLARILDLHPEANLEAFSPLNPNTSTVFWHAVVRASRKDNTDAQTKLALRLVNRMLDLNPKVNVNAGPKGVLRGATALYFAGLSLDSPTLSRMLESPQPNIEAGPVNEDSKRQGDTVLWKIVERGLWPAFVTALARNPYINFDSQYSTPTGTSKSLIKFLENPRTPEYVRVAIVLNLLLRQPNDGVQMVDFLTTGNVYWLNDTRNRLIPIFRHVANAFPHFGQQTILETNRFNYFDDRNLKWHLALTTLREMEPELKNIPDVVLKAALVRFQDAFKQVDYNKRKLDVIEAGILKIIFPVEKRTERNRKTIIKIRGWIRDAVNYGIAEGILPADLPAEVRAAIVEAFLRNSPRHLTKIKRQTFMDAVNEMRGTVFAQVQDNQVAENEAESNNRKRSREEQVEAQDPDSLKIILRLKRPATEAEPAPAPDANLREGLVREVIREAPGLNLAEINARVDELMAEDNLPPANTNAPEVPEVITDFPIDGPMDPDSITQSGVDDKLGLSRRFNG